MSDADRLRKEINYLSVLIQKHKEGKALTDRSSRADASKYTWSSTKLQGASNGPNVGNVQYLSNPARRERKRHQFTHGLHVPNKMNRSGTPPTADVMARKTGVAFDSKFKWTKNSQNAAKADFISVNKDSSQFAKTETQSPTKNVHSSIITSASNVARTIPVVSVPKLTSAHPQATHTMKNTRYKYHKTATSTGDALTNVKIKTMHRQNVRPQHPPKRLQKWPQKRPSLVYRRKSSTSKWASRSATVNPYKLNRVTKPSMTTSTTKKLQHFRPTRGHHSIRKSPKYGRIVDKRERNRDTSTHITLSKAAFEGLLQKHSLTLRQALAKRAVAKSHETARFNKKHEKKKQYCLYYGRFGKCMRGDSCKFIHDPSRIAVCTRFLRGTCRNKDCSFSHTVEKEKIPVCLFFLRGKCSVQSCPYLHVFLGRDAPVCRQFASTGFCLDADKCKMQHIKCCPEYYETGKCPKAKACELPHFRIHKYRQKVQASKNEKSQSDEQGTAKIQTGSDIKVDNPPSSPASCPDFLSLSVEAPQPMNRPVKRETTLIKPRFGKLLSKPTSSSSQ